MFAEEGAYDHLVKIRKAPYAPISRETADHSLPYIVAAAVLDGFVRTDSFAPSRVLEPDAPAFRRREGDGRAAIRSSAPSRAASTSGAEAGYLGRVEIEIDRRHGGARRREAVSGPSEASVLRRRIWRPSSRRTWSRSRAASAPRSSADASRAIETLKSVRDLTGLLALPEGSGVDDAKAE